MTARANEDNETATRIFAIAIAVAWALFFASTGLVGFVSGLGLGLLFWISGAGIRGAVLAVVVLAGASAGIHYLEGWRVASLVEWPLYFGRLVFNAVQTSNPAPVLDAWLNGWKVSRGASPVWFGLHAALLTAVAYTAAQIFAAIADASPEGQYRRQKREIAQQNSQQAPAVGKMAQARLNRADAARKEATLIGKARGGKDVYLTDAGANTHTLVVGTTGSGKTVTVLNLVESFIKRGLPVLYVDGKGDRALGERIVAYAQAEGQGGHLFAMVGQSCHYNPLASGSYTSKKDRLIELREWSEPHYRKLAEGYLQMVFKVLGACGITANLCDVAGYLARAQLAKLVRDTVAAGRIDDATGKALMAEIEEQAAAEKHVEGVAAEVRNLAKSELGSLFAGDGLVIGEALRNNQVVYMGLNPLQFPALATILGRLIVNDFKATLDPSHATKMLVVFDEFGVFAGDQVLNVINQGRSAGICAVLTVQSVSDIGRAIEKNADHFIEQVFSNCNNYLIHRVNSASNAEQLAAVIGTHASHQLTAQIGSDGPTGVGSVRQTREFIIHPDKIKGLRTGEAIYLDRNNNRVTEMQARKGELA